MERLGSFYRILTALALMGCLSLGYYEDVFFENLFDNMDLVESYEVEKEKEEKETEKEKEIDELFNQLVDKFDFDTTYSSLLHNGLGKYMPSHYLDEFTPPPELV